MELKIIASTTLDSVADKEKFDYLAGVLKGMEDSSSNFEELKAEESEKTSRRIALAKEEGDEKFFKTSSFSFYVSGLPKILSYMLEYYNSITVVDKEGRFEEVKLSSQEELIFNKWVEIFKKKIVKLYKKDYPAYFSDARIKKLANDNARYLLSVFRKTDVIVCSNYADFNKFIAVIEKIIANENISPFYLKVGSVLEEFLEGLKSLPYYDQELVNGFSKTTDCLLADDKKNEEYYSDSYSSVYNSSFLYLGEALPLGGMEYKFKILEGEYYIPELLSDSPEFAELWLSDIKSLGEDYFPMCCLLEIEERGTLDGFIEKLFKTKCTYTQLELNKRTNETLSKYEYALRLKVHPRAEGLITYTAGAKCQCGFDCKQPCEFELGINETRRV